MWQSGIGSGNEIRVLRGRFITLLSVARSRKVTSRRCDSAGRASLERERNTAIQQSAPPWRIQVTAKSDLDKMRGLTGN